MLPILAAAPCALIETREVNRTDSNNFSVSVKAVDGQAYMGNRQDMKLTPDVHWVVMTAEYSGTQVAKRHYEKSLYMLAKPCIRYLVTGQRENALDSDWKVRIFAEEKILSCKTKEDIEREKAERKAKAREMASTKTELVPVYDAAISDTATERKP